MTKRRTSTIGHGHGTHQGELHATRKRPAGQVKRIISKSKHGKAMHDNEEKMPLGMEIIAQFMAIRRSCRNLIFWALVFTVFAVAMCSATSAHSQPNTEFRSLFQIRRALPDTVQLIHVGYNLRVTQVGVECVPLNPRLGIEPAIPVQSWIQGDSGEWIGVTKSGGTITLRGKGEGQYLEITSGGQTIFYYYMVPGILTLQMEPQN